MIIKNAVCYSFYTFGLERMLSVMLLQLLAENQPQTLDLLAPDRPSLATYQAFIQRDLVRAHPISPPPQLIHRANLFERVLSRLRRKAP